MSDTTDKPTIAWATKREAAEHIRVNPEIIAEAVRDGDLPAYPIGKGRDYRLDLAEVDAWLRSKSYEPRRYGPTRLD